MKAGMYMTSHNVYFATLLLDIKMINYMSANRGVLRQYAYNA
jgi:hypothetical protein